MLILGLFWVTFGVILASFLGVFSRFQKVAPRRRKKRPFRAGLWSKFGHRKQKCPVELQPVAEQAHVGNIQGKLMKHERFYKTRKRFLRNGEPESSPNPGGKRSDEEKKKKLHFDGILGSFLSH